MKVIIFILLLLPSCQLGPDGKRHYVGPKIKGAITYKGIGIELTLFDPLNPLDERVLDLTPMKPPSNGKQPVTP